MAAVLFVIRRLLSFALKKYPLYGIDRDEKLPVNILKIMGWDKNNAVASHWSRILRETFMDEGTSSNGKYYIDLSRVKPRFSFDHKWYCCEQCSEFKTSVNLLEKTN